MFIQLRDYVMYALERVNNYWPRDQNQGPLYTEPADWWRQVRDRKDSEPDINTAVPDWAEQIQEITKKIISDQRQKHPKGLKSETKLKKIGDDHDPRL